MDVKEIDEILAAAPIMAVVVVPSADKAVGLSRTLTEAGNPLIEVTLRTPAAVEAIAAVAREVPAAIIGAGTIVSKADYDAVVAAGARFAISPGATPALLKACADGPIPLLPGVATASELMVGMEAGFSRFKFFPAEAAGGAGALKALHGPFPDIRFCPTGGIGPDNAARYWALANVACVGGSWIAPSDLIARGDFAEIGRLTRDAIAISAKAKLSS
jgi:2-dehydro-3-deoxyphosphogluconate aldolase / (4S)-4-hydroxy-2-oxoglutarate aldolase